MDVCPNPQDKVCRVCDALNPGPDHQCSPRCKLCGGTHMTADHNCRARAAEEVEVAANATSPAGKPRSRSRARSRGRSQSRSRTPNPRQQQQRRSRSRIPRRTSTRDTETTEKQSQMPPAPLPCPLQTGNRHRPGATNVHWGDFNAVHTAWGYKHDHPKGTHLWATVEYAGLELVTDPAAPTRQGNSVSTDTTPDLTFTCNTRKVIWTSTMQDLGSNHYIISIETGDGPQEHNAGRQMKITNWNQLRKHRDEQQVEDIKDIEEWTDQRRWDIERMTQTIPSTAGLEAIDSWLLHMWKAKTHLQHRWKQQRHNRRLRKRIVQLNKEIEKHAPNLQQQQWEEKCAKMDGQLTTRCTWQILRYLIDPANTKTTHMQGIYKIIQAYGGTEEQFLRDAERLYISQTTPQIYSDNSGESNATLDAELAFAEIQAALVKLNTKSAPGPDRIPNRALRNLDYGSIEKLTKYINECWAHGKLPQQWKEANIILIPKPGKKLQLENLRPISITSCVGKLMEHAFLNRLTDYLVDNDLFPFTMIGLRRHLSTQDDLL
ncbi:uncharacterized protein [Dermacentor andersoni]|uniref:uncharacterized protein n=1 Tax=Dermacentor andersoni TaxID=34620 RepID=UPI003B3B5D62